MPMDRRANVVRLTAADNVAVALSDIAAGELAIDRAQLTVRARERIPQGHKIALEPIAADEPIIRFGMPVGLAKAAIETGALVHIHNVRSQYLDNEVDHYE
jgi:altronate hydrolase